MEHFQIKKDLLCMAEVVVGKEKWDDENYSSMSKLCK